MTPSRFFSSSLLITVLFLPPFARAQGGACPSLEGKVGIVIGGKGATTDAMSKCYADSPDLLAVGETDGASLVDCFAKRIDARPKSAKKFVVVGHSSGSVHAEHVVQRVRQKDSVRLVLLEGIGSPRNQKGVETSCWYAKSGARTGFNGPSMLDKRNCPRGATAIETPQCGANPLCLHVSLVNSNASPSLTRANVFARGLDDCVGNRAWLGSEF